METTITMTKRTRAAVKDVKPAIDEVMFDLEWTPIAKRYFGKCPSWIYNKLKCRDGNGGIGGFTDAKIEQLSEAFYDFADRLRAAAEELKKLSSNS